MMIQRRRDAGFSLIELILITALLGVMAGAYFLNAFDFTASTLERATRRLENDLRYTQQLAMTEETNHGFISTGNQTYTIYRLNVGTPITDPHTQQAMNVDLTTDYQGVAFAGNYQVEFDNRGRPILGGGSQITLNNGNQTRIVTVTQTTGYIQIQ